MRIVQSAYTSGHASFLASLEVLHAQQFRLPELIGWCEANRTDGGGGHIWCLSAGGVRANEAAFMIEAQIPGAKAFASPIDAEEWLWQQAGPEAETVWAANSEGPARRLADGTFVYRHTPRPALEEA